MNSSHDSPSLVLPELAGSTVTLRAFRPTDAPAIQEASQDELIPLITTVPTTDDHDAALAYIARQHERLQLRVGYSFAISNDEGVAVGHIGLWMRDADQGRASIGYWILPSARRCGYATEALSVITDWAFTLPAMRRLQLYVEPWNVGSWRAAEKVGFEREGLLRSWELVGGLAKDMFMYSLLTRELRHMEGEVDRHRQFDATHGVGGDDRPKRSSM